MNRVALKNVSTVPAELGTRDNLTLCVPLPFNTVSKLHFDYKGRTFSYFIVSQKPYYVVALSLVAITNNCRETSSEL